MRLFSNSLGLALLSLFALAAPARAQTVPVRVGVIPIIGAAPIFVANGEGWTKEAGLDLKFTTFESGPNMIQALASGTIDVYVGGVMPLAVARTKGVGAKVVTATAVEEMVFVAAPRLAPYFGPGVAPADALKRKRREDHGFEGLLTAPAYRAVFVQLTRSEVRERSSLEAALLELLAAAAWAGIVPADALERVNKRLGHVGKGQTNILRGKGQMNIFRTGCPPLLILLGCIRESVPARELADRILKGSNHVVLETRHALGIGQGSSKIRAKAIVVHRHGFDQTAPERLADNIG